MGKIKQTFAWWCNYQGTVEPKTLLQEAKKIGYLGTEFVDESLWDLVYDTGLIVSCGPANDIATGPNHRERHDRFEDDVCKALDKAAKYKVPNLVIFSGNREGVGDVEGAVNCVEGLLRVAKVAEEKGVNLALETLNSKCDHIDYQCDHTDFAVNVVKAVNSPRVKVLYDIYHMQVMEGDVIATIKKNIDHICHIHTAGVPGRNDMDDTQELNYPGIMKAIAATNYAGYVGQEYCPKGDAIEALKLAYKLCDV
jgi:hydroxypyruvate isomerase